MRLQDYDSQDGKRVWLTEAETELLLDEMESGRQWRAACLAARSGLRRDEIVSVRVRDVVDAPDGYVRVWGDFAKQDKYREAPITDELQSVVERSLADIKGGDEPIVDVDPTTVYRWVDRAGQRLAADTNDEGWLELGVHDLRRTWGAHLLWNHGLLPSSVMAFGGWEDWGTFREHYLGEMSPKAMDRERAKVDWMGAGETDDEAPSSVFKPEGTAGEITAAERQ